MSRDLSYQPLLARGQQLYPGVRIGRPGRSAGYWPTVVALRALRLGVSVRVEGARQVGRGPAVLVGNHVHALDPVVAVMGRWWRVTAFTKVEMFEGAGAAFFRAMGQIPLRRGDETSTEWALEMAVLALRSGSKIGLYPEGTRSPDPAHLHRLHKRVMVPLLQAVPDVPVHAVATSYLPGGRRRHALVRVSPPLPLDAATHDAQRLTAAVRDALLALSGQTYVDEYARDVKRRLAARDGRSPEPAP